MNGKPYGTFEKNEKGSFCKTKATVINMAVKGQHNYSFRNRDWNETTAMHPTGNPTGEIVITDEWEIIAPQIDGDDGRLCRYAARDLLKFLNDGFGICPRLRFCDTAARKDALSAPARRIILLPDESEKTAEIASDRRAAFFLSAKKDTVIITGKSDRGMAQGVYYLEDAMRLSGTPTIPAEQAEHAPLFSPRMTHSGTELDVFPDSFLEAAAHAGMDAIIVYAGHPDTNLHGFLDPDPLWDDSKMGYCDYSNLVWRAAGFGIDVYIYSHLLCDMYPTDPGAEEYYDKSFGTLFRKNPGLAGIILVGETFEFPSRDTHTCGTRFQLKAPGEVKPSTGFYPSYDYPELLTVVRNAIRKYNKDADIVFWTYNFGWASKEARLSLIRSLPTDISLLVTFDMWQQFRSEEGVPYSIDDYSISFEGPSDVYLQESAENKPSGRRFYSMANTGGRTWDSGAAPYLPVPDQWIRRYEALRRSYREHDLRGLMEDHHYGWTPSFLSLLEKNAFTTNGLEDGEMLHRIAVRDWGENASLAEEAWAAFSRGIRRVIASGIDQYGPYRCGPTYPMLFDQKEEDLHIPAVPWAWHGGGGIWHHNYPDRVTENPDFTIFRLARVREVEAAFSEGCAALDRACPATREQKEQAALARFLLCTYRTTEHVIRWTAAKILLLALCEGRQPEKADAIAKAIDASELTVPALVTVMEDAAKSEAENVAKAVVCYDTDSRIGFEASMEYTFDREYAAWKLAETEESLRRLHAYVAAH